MGGFNAISQTPSEAVLYVTSKCNGACPFCLRNQAGYAPIPDMTPEIVEEVLSLFPRIRSACVAGFGEPLKHKNIDEIFRTLARNGVYVGLITNGTLLDDAFDDIEWRNVGHVSVSLNAADAQEHEACFGVKGGFDAVLSGLESLRCSSIQTIISFVISKDNWSRVPDYLELVRRLGLSNVVMTNTLPHGDFNDQAAQLDFFHDKLIRTTDTEIVESLGRWELEAKQSGLRVAAWPIPISMTIPKLCLSPFTRIGVDGRGDITGCIRIIPPKPEHGNIAQGPLVWATSPHLKELRDGLTGVAPLNPACRACFGNWIRS